MSALRWLTAIVMIAICGLCVAQGWGVAHFALASENIDSSEKRAEIINTWKDVPGLAATALRAELDYAIDTSDLKAANRRREAIAAILSIKPLASIDWLGLSGMQLITDRPMDQVLETLRLSILTGPNESDVMVERAIFALSLWEVLTPDLKSRVAVDLGPLISPISPAGEAGAKFRVALSAKPERVRAELREALVATGVSSKEIERGLGF